MERLFRLAIWSSITPVLITITFFIIASTSEGRSEKVYIQRIFVDGKFNKDLFLVVGQYLFLFNTQYYFLSMAKYFKFLNFVEIQKRVVRSFYLPIFVSSNLSWVVYVFLGAETPKNII